MSSVELYQWSGHSKDVNEIFRQLMILQSLRSVGQPRGCEKILPSIDFSLESGIPSWDETKYSRSLEHSCLEKRLLSSHIAKPTISDNKKVVDPSQLEALPVACGSLLCPDASSQLIAIRAAL